MPTTFLTKDHYDAVRGLIAPDVTAVHISDAYIEQQPFAPDAERTVRRHLLAEGIDIDTLTGDARDDALLAMIHQCMANMALSVPQVLRTTQLEILTEVQSIDWKEKQMFHLSQVDEKVSAVMVSVATADSASTKGARRVPFAAVGTERREVGVPRFPYRRVPITSND